MKWLISESDYQSLIQGAVLLEQDGFGPKVYRLENDRILKLFRIKRLLSQSLFYPYTFRFRRNSLRLKKLGIPTVRVTQVFYCPSIARHGLIYPMLEGQTMLDYLRAGDIEQDVMNQMGRFIARLHRLGIYFRSLHLGNILRLENGEMALIDIADMRFRPWSLTVNQRTRNFRHFVRNTEHLALLQKIDTEEFIDAYLGEAQLVSAKTEGLRKKIAISLTEAE